MSQTCVLALTQDDFDQQVLRHSGTVLVDFYTRDCPPCRQVAPILEELCAEHRATLKVVKINAEENFELAWTHRISAVPTFVLYHGGKKLAQITGFQSKPQFEKWIELSLEGAA
jgi:thioredoxin 1